MTAPRRAGSPLEAGPFAALGHRFGVRSTDRELGEAVAAVLTTLATDEESAVDGWYDIDPVGDSRHRLTWQGQPVAERARPANVARMLAWHVNRLAVDSALADHVVLHAGGVTRAGRALLLAAPMEAGKTTLAAGLVDRGWAYLTDEAVAVTLDGGTVLPYPKPLSIDPGSQSVLAHWRAGMPDVLATPSRPRQWQVAVTGVGGQVAGPARPGGVVLPHYKPGAATRLEPVARAEALAELATCAFAWHGDDLAERFAALAETVRLSACARLVTGELDEACRQLERWWRDEVGEATRRAG